MGNLSVKNERLILIKDIILDTEMKMLEIVKNEISSGIIDLEEREQLEKLNFVVEYLQNYYDKKSKMISIEGVHYE
ncbi:MAG: hypothetical protein E6182_18830 [Clostridioides difficile]|nr:hypothetical protein [Clostridioides difficile]